MTEANRPQAPMGPSETKAIGILLSAKQVAEEVEAFRQALNNPLVQPKDAERYTRDMNDALTRLCNLISLAIANINASVGEQFRLSFDLLLDEVRSRLLHMNFHMIQERLVAIRAQVEAALADPVHRLGLSNRLERDYGDAVNMLTAMGETEELDLPPMFLEDIIKQIRELSAIEIRVFKLIDFDALERAKLPRPRVTAPVEPELTPLEDLDLG